ncbi:glycosyltransferase family 39 protein [Methanocella sp. MCL-LM]|uniref:glycosyltransferase family 39 protein n=1 Tax=Methanocella sp. MCL-LM TaxID=3412035 RepID=UPI003C7209E8
MKGGISDRQYLIGSLVLTGLLVAAITVLAGVFTLRVWQVGDTRIFYEMAEVILRGGTPYVDYLDPKPPLIFFLLTLPLTIGHKLAGGLVLVGMANYASVVLILLLGWKLYGRKAGLLAAVLFAINFSLAEGYFIITEPFTVTFLLLSAYFLICGPDHPLKKYLLAGISAGIAIGFKQYALLLLPLSIYFMWRKKEYYGFLPYMAGVIIPLAIMFGAIFARLRSPLLGEAALHWSFGVAGSYVTEGDVEGVPAYKIDDPIIALAWLVLGVSLFSPLLLLAGAALLDRKLSLAEEFLTLAGLAFAATLIIRPFLHYWALALPFLILLAASGLSGDAPRRTISFLKGLSDRAFLAGASVLYAVVLLVFSLVSAVLVDALWRPLEIMRFYGLADIVLKATSPYMQHVPEPSLAALDLSSSGQSAAGGILLSAGLLLLAALVLTKIGTDVYGRRAGFLAGTLFTCCIAWVLGYLDVSDALAVLLLVASVYGAISGTIVRYLLCGLCLGAAVALKPLAILALPALAFLAFRRGDTRRIPLIIAGAVAVPLAATSLAVLLIPGAVPVPGGITISLLPLTAHEGGYVVPDPLIAMLNLAMGAVLLTILLPAAAMALAKQPRGHFEESMLLAGVLMLLALLARQYVHYWYLALPFLALACAGAFMFPVRLRRARADRKT